MPPFAYPLTGMITIFALLVYLVVTFNVGRARVRFDVPAPRIDGPEEFMRYFRVQMNTLEQLALFLPLLWLAAVSVNDGLAAALGLFWPVARIVYARKYYRNPKKRGPAFLIGMISATTLLLVALYGTISAFIHQNY